MRKGIFVLLFGILPFVLTAQIKVTLDADQAKTQISRNIYGHFAEHIGRLIYGGLYVGENNAGIPNTLRAARAARECPNHVYRGVLSRSTEEFEACIQTDGRH